MKSKFAAASTMLLMIWSPFMARAQSGTMSVDDIIKVVEQSSQQLQSARIEGVETHKVTPDFDRVMHVRPGGEGPPPQRPVVWAFKGEKRFKQYTDYFTPQSPHNQQLLARNAGNERLVHLSISLTKTQIFDGKKFYTLLTEQDSGIKEPSVQGNIGYSDRTEVLPLSFGLQVEGKWLADVLRSGQYKLDGTSNDARFGTLYQFSGTTDTTHEETQNRFWLAPRQGFLAVRVEQDIKAKASSGQRRVTFQLQSAEQRGSIWFPTAGTMQFFETGNGKPLLLSERGFKATRFELNNVPDSLFTPELRTGYRLRDEATNEFWRIGPNGEKIFIDITSKEEKSSMSFGWLFMASMTTLLMLGMGALWRRRQRRSAAS